MYEDRYSRGATWEHGGERLTVLCSDIRLGMPYVHFMWDTPRGALRSEMTEANGWRFVGRPTESASRTHALPRSAEEIAREMIVRVDEEERFCWFAVLKDGAERRALMCLNDEDTYKAAEADAAGWLTRLIEQARADGAAAVLAGQQPSDLAGRIRALIQEKAGEYADAAHDGPRSFALQETMRWLRNAYAHPHYSVDPLRVVAILREHAYPPLAGVYLRTADELEAIVRECAPEAQ